jgi:hypothetical protein
LFSWREEYQSPPDCGRAWAVSRPVSDGRQHARQHPRQSHVCSCFSDGSRVSGCGLRQRAVALVA